MCNMYERELFKTVASLVRWSEKDISVYNLKGVIVKENLSSYRYLGIEFTISVFSGHLTRAAFPPKRYSRSRKRKPYSP